MTSKSAEIGMQDQYIKNIWTNFLGVQKINPSGPVEVDRFISISIF